MCDRAGHVQPFSPPLPDCRSQFEDFYRPGFATVFAAIVELYENGVAVDAVTVGNVLQRKGTLDEVGGVSGLLEMSINVPSSLSASSYALIIRKEASARRLHHVFVEGCRSLSEGRDAVEVAEAAEERIRAIDRGGRLPERYWRSWDDYGAAEHEGAGVPLVEGMTNLHTRTILLATEKLGKSMLARQIAFCVAAGVHPFNFQPITPVRVLVLDAENDDDELLPSRKRLTDCLTRTPAAKATRPALMSSPYGLDLRSRRDRSELEEVLEDVRPQLIVGGPIYKMLPQADGVSDPRHAERLQQIFDSIRKRWGCALLLEHHAPSGKPGSEREIRSIGGQRWAAWPEVTIALHARKNSNGPDSAEVRYPHPARGRFRWPKRFERGINQWEWPWVPVLRQTDVPKSDPLPIEEQPF